MNALFPNQRAADSKLVREGPVQWILTPLPAWVSPFRNLETRAVARLLYRHLAVELSTPITRLAVYNHTYLSLLRATASGDLRMVLASARSLHIVARLRSSAYCLRCN